MSEEYSEAQIQIIEIVVWTYIEMVMIIVYARF